MRGKQEMIRLSVMRSVFNRVVPDYVCVCLCMCVYIHMWIMRLALEMTRAALTICKSLDIHKYACTAV